MQGTGQNNIQEQRSDVWMVDLKNINNNIIANRWKQRYAEQPEAIKEKLDKLNDMSVQDYQLQIIKRKRLYPQIGDVFILKPTSYITLQGIVINNHINNINGDDLLLVLIFKPDVNIEAVISEGVKYCDLIISPVMVGKEYWTRGYFNNISNINLGNIKNYGFYSIGKGKFLNEYGKELVKEPELLGTYGVATISGIAREINQELIIAGVL